MILNRERPVRIRVPASTSNLGPGFDVLGMAVDRGVEVTFRPGDPRDRLHVVRGGTLETLDLPPDRDPLVVSARKRLGGPLSGTLEVTADMPVGKGTTLTHEKEQLEQRLADARSWVPSWPGTSRTGRRWPWPRHEPKAIRTMPCLPSWAVWWRPGSTPGAWSGPGSP